MTGFNEDRKLGQELVEFFTKELEERSQKLFYARVDAMMGFYRSIFDDRPDCIEIIGTPANGRVISPTLYMVYREARFVLDSDPSERERLDADWTFLHIKVQGDLNPEHTAKMLALNTNARWQVVKCQDRLADLVRQVSELIGVGDYDEASRLFDIELAVVDETFDKIIDSYNQLALQPH